MNAPVTRRAMLGVTAAVGFTALPIAGPALAGTADLDAELFGLLDRWREAWAAWRVINDGAFDDVHAAR